MTSSEPVSARRAKHCGEPGPCSSELRRLFSSFRFRILAQDSLKTQERLKHAANIRDSKSKYFYLLDQLVIAGWILEDFRGYGAFELISSVIHLIHKPQSKNVYIFIFCYFHITLEL